MTVRVGVVADTHYPEFLERLPARLFDVLRGVDLILHAGDVGGEEALAELRQIAPIEAVRGDHDRSLATLPVMREVIVEGKKIVIVHGNRSAWLEEPQTFLWTITLGYYEPHRGLPRTLRRRFPEADIIVFGLCRYGRPHARLQPRRRAPMDPAGSCAQARSEAGVV